MLKLTIKIFTFTLLFFFIDRIIGNYLFNVGQSNNYDKRIEKLINNELKFDLLILGSSRAARNIIASEITNTTKLTAYNLGFPGSNIDFHKKLLELAIESGFTPKFIVLVVDDEKELIENKSTIFRYDLLYPYTNNDKIKSILIDRDQINDTLSKISITYNARYNAVNIFTDLFLYILNNKKVNPLFVYQQDGSMPLDSKSITWDSINYDNNRSLYNKKNESAFLLTKYRQFIEICSLNNIDLIIIFPPNYKSGSDTFVARIKEISGSNVQYFNYSSIVMDKSLFYDSSHLNKDGAIKLSIQFAQDLNKRINILK